MASQSLDPGSGSSKSSSTRLGYTGLWELPDLGEERNSVGSKDRHRSWLQVYQYNLEGLAMNLT